MFILSENARFSGITGNFLFLSTHTPGLMSSLCEKLCIFYFLCDISSPTFHPHAAIQSSDGFLSILRTISIFHLLDDYRKTIREEYLFPELFGFSLDKGS